MEKQKTETPKLSMSALFGMREAMVSELDIHKAKVAELEEKIRSIDVVTNMFSAGTASSASQDAPLIEDRRNIGSMDVVILAEATAPKVRQQNKNTTKPKKIKKAVKDLSDSQKDKMQQFFSGDKINMIREILSDSPDGIKLQDLFDKLIKRSPLEIRGEDLKSAIKKRLSNTLYVMSRTGILENIAVDGADKNERVWRLSGSTT